MNNKHRPVVISEQRCNMVPIKKTVGFLDMKDLTANLDTF